LTRFSELAPERLTGIDLLVLDVDGVLTDGRIRYADTGAESKVFHVHDGTAIKYWHRAGRHSALISGRASPILARRARELGVAHWREDAKDKAAALGDLLAALGAPPDTVAYMGDDLPDIPAMRLVGLSIAVANAVAEVRDFADAVTQHCGGDGAVREVVEAMLKTQGRWSRILARYFPESAD